MALQKQLIELRPQGGLRQEASKWLQVPFHTLNNLIYDKFGAVQKRPPIVALTGDMYGGSALSPSFTVSPISTPTNELFQVAYLPRKTEKDPAEYGTCLFAYSPTADAWARKATLPSTRVRRFSGIRGQTSLNSYPPQVCRIGKYECILYSDTGGGYIRLIDRETGAVLLDNTTIVTGSAGGLIGKVALIDCGDNLFTFVYMNSTATQFRRATLNPATLATNVVNVGLAFGTVISAWDCCPSTTGFFLLTFSERTVGTSILRVTNSTGVVTHTATETGTDTTVSVAFKQLSTATAAMLWSDGFISYLRLYNANTLATLTAVEIFITNPFDASIVNNLTVGFDVNGLVQCFASGKLPTSLYYSTKWKLYYPSDNTWSNGSVAYELPWTLVQSKPFVLGFATYILVARYRLSSPEGARYGYALLNLDRVNDKISSDRPAALEGCFAVTDGVGMTYSMQASHTPWISSSGYEAVLPILVRGRGTSGIFGNVTWADVIELGYEDAFIDPDLWHSCFASKLLHINGALPVQFDGQTACEIGYLEPPQHVYNNTPAETLSASGLEPGTYEYLFTWEWFDAHGNRHESRAGDPMLVTIVGGPNALLTFKVTTSGMVRRGNVDDGIGSKPKLVVYRSKKNAADNHYRLPITTTYNDPQAYDLTVVDISSDNDVAVAALGQFYGDGGILENEVPPPALHMQVSGGRVWLTSAELPEVWPSKELLDGEPPGFSPFLKLTLDDAQTRLVGTSYLDGLLVIFSESRIYTVPAASGPSDAGQGLWPRPEEVQSSGGCISPASILSYAQGVFYRDVDGFKLLTRGRTIEPIGDAVRDVTDQYPITMNVSLDVAREKIYCLVASEEGATIFVVYDFSHNAWSTASTTIVQDEVEVPWINVRMAMWSGDPVFSYNTRIHRMDPTVSSGYDLIDGSTSTWITSSLATPWILLGALGGYQRVWRVVLELEKLSDHGFTLTFFNDGEETTPSQTETWTDAEVSAMQGLPRERVLVGVAQQKCQSMKLKLVDSAPVVADTGNPAGFRYHGVSLEIGVKLNSEKAEKGNTR